MMTTQNFSRLISCILVIVLCGVITSGFGYQIAYGEQPCPLCFIARVCMIGVAVGQILNFRFGIKMVHHGLSLFSCIVGGADSLRQVGLHVCPNFAPYGTPVLGLGLYTWAFIVFVCCAVVIGVLMCLYNPNWKPSHSKWLKYLERFAFVYLILIIAIDIAIAGAVCGLKVCPDNPG